MAAADDIRRLNEEIASLSRKLGKGPLRVFEPNELEEAKATLSGLRYEFSEMEGSATNIYDKLRGITSELRGQETATQGIRKAFRSITADATKLRNDEQEIEKLTSKDLRNLQQRVRKSKASLEDNQRRLLSENDIAKEISRQVEDLKSVGAEQDFINEYVSDYLKSTTELTEEQKAMLLSYFDQNKAVDELLKKTKERLKFEEEIDKKVKGFTILKDIVKSIPGLKAFAGPFEAAEKAAREAAEQGKSGLKIYAAGGDAIMKAFGPVAFLTATLKFLKDVAFNVSKQTTEIGKSMGLSATNAEIVRDQMVAIQDASKDELVTTEKLLEARTQLSKVLGASVRYTKQQLTDQITLTERVGLQAEQAANIEKLSMLSGQSADKSLDAVNAQIAGLAKQTGIQLDNRDILNEVANTNGQIAATLGNNPGRIAAAVMQVRRLGLELTKARDISSSLLDFESSIEKELHAELLTNKELNLERARSLALQGDFAGAAAEVAKQVGTIEEFQNLNVIAQEALAEAAGMTADELSNSMTQTKLLADLGQQNREELEKQVAALKAQGRVEEANRLMSSIGSEKDLKAAQEKIDAQTRFNAALDKAKSIFADMFKDVGGIGESLVGIISGLVQMKPLLVTIAGLYATMAIRSQMVAIANMFSASAKTAWMLGPYGLVAAAAIAGAGALYMNSQMKSVKVDDAVINPDGGLMVTGQKGSIQLNKDDSIIAGTNLGGSGGSSELVKEIRALRAVMEKGGNVYMDGSKVGHVLALAQTRQ